MTLLKDWGITPMVTELPLEVNCAFSALVFWGSANPGALPHAGGEYCAFGAFLVALARSQTSAGHASQKALGIFAGAVIIGSGFSDDLAPGGLAMPKLCEGR